MSIKRMSIKRTQDNFVRVSFYDESLSDALRNLADYIESNKYNAYYTMTSNYNVELHKWEVIVFFIPNPVK
jgi:hypothetical protein